MAQDEILEFNVKHMKTMPTDWRLPRGLYGFSACQVARKFAIQITLKAAQLLFVADLTAMKQAIRSSC